MGGSNNVLRHHTAIHLQVHANINRYMHNALPDHSRMDIAQLCTYHFGMSWLHGLCHGYMAYVMVANSYVTCLKLEHIDNGGKRLSEHNISVVCQACHNGGLHKVAWSVNTLQEQ